MSAKQRVRGPSVLERQRELLLEKSAHKLRAAARGEQRIARDADRLLLRGVQHSRRPLADLGQVGLPLLHLLCERPDALWTRGHR